jgi:hypothetical protein
LAADLIVQNGIVCEPGPAFAHVGLEESTYRVVAAAAGSAMMTDAPNNKRESNPAVAERRQRQGRPKRTVEDKALLRGLRVPSKMSAGI